MEPADSVVLQGSDERAARQIAPVTKPKTTPTSAIAPATALPARAKPRFDMDGDGKDELVMSVAEETVGGAVLVRYSTTSLRVLVVPPAGHHFAHGVTSGDFNGDGFADLAVPGARLLSPGVFEQGIFVYHGGSTGLDRDNARYLPGLRAGALAAGDINKDGKDELALTDGGANAEGHAPFRGSVTVLSGTASGLTKDGLVEIHQVVPGWPGMVEEDFGTSLAMGDFTGDGYADLAVAGTRRGATESDAHGMLTLFQGSASGPSSAGVTKLEGQLDLPNVLPIDVMVMSDMNQDGREDLILGLPRHRSGEIIYLPGAASGLDPVGHRLLDQNTPGIPGHPDSDANGGNFGYSLATGDATGDGVPDLLVGALTMSVGGVADAGSVTLIPGTPQGPTGGHSLVYTQRVPVPWNRRPSPQNAEPAEPKDYLGSAVALLDLDGTGPLEMLVEAKYEDMWQQAPGQPNGLITTLRLNYATPRRGSTLPPSPVGLAPVMLQRPADLSQPGIQILYLRYGLLSS